MMWLTVKYSATPQVSGEPDVVSNDGHWIVKGSGILWCPCCCYWRKTETFEEAMRWPRPQHHLPRDTVISESCLVFPLEEALRAWLKVLHAVYQPTRGLRMSWLLQCVHLHVCMCSNRKINTGVMYISSNLILGICLCELQSWYIK
jgi:hypothetical protein